MRSKAEAQRESRFTLELLGVPEGALIHPLLLCDIPTLAVGSEEQPEWWFFVLRMKRSTEAKKCKRGGNV